MSRLEKIAGQILNPRPNRPTIILIHGGWEGPEVYSLIVPRLEKAGYSVFAPSLPSSHTVPAISSFDEDVKIIRHAVDSTLETGKDVILVMHSYGALPGCEALKGINLKKSSIITGAGTHALHTHRTGAVLKMVFLAGIIVPEGGSTERPGTIGNELTGFQYKDELITVVDAPSRFYNDLSTAEAAYWASRTKPQSRPAFRSELTYAAWRYIPSSYLLCTADAALPFKVQEKMCRLAGITEATGVDSGHSPHISQPVITERFIRKSAGEFLSVL